MGVSPKRMFIMASTLDTCSHFQKGTRNFSSFILILLNFEFG